MAAPAPTVPHDGTSQQAAAAFTTPEKRLTNTEAAMPRAPPDARNQARPPLTAANTDAEAKTTASVERKGNFPPRRKRYKAVELKKAAKRSGAVHKDARTILAKRAGRSGVREASGKKMGTPDATRYCAIWMDAA
jgi:hypothetical protein